MVDWKMPLTSQTVTESPFPWTFTRGRAHVVSLPKALSIDDQTTGYHLARIRPPSNCLPHHISHENRTSGRRESDVTGHCSCEFEEIRTRSLSVMWAIWNFSNTIGALRKAFVRQIRLVAYAKCRRKVPTYRLSCTQWCSGLGSGTTWNEHSSALPKDRLLKPQLSKYPSTLLASNGRKRTMLVSYYVGQATERWMSFQ